MGNSRHAHAPENGSTDHIATVAENRKTGWRIDIEGNLPPTRTTKKLTCQLEANQAAISDLLESHAREQEDTGSQLAMSEGTQAELDALREEETRLQAAIDAPRFYVHAIHSRNNGSVGDYRLEVTLDEDNFLEHVEWMPSLRKVKERVRTTEGTEQTATAVPVAKERREHSGTGKFVTPDDFTQNEAQHGIHFTEHNILPVIIGFQCLKDGIDPRDVASVVRYHIAEQQGQSAGEDELPESVRAIIEEAGEGRAPLPRDPMERMREGIERKAAEEAAAKAAAEDEPPKPKKCDTSRTVELEDLRRELGLEAGSGEGVSDGAHEGAVEADKGREVS